MGLKDFLKKRCPVCNSKVDKLDNAITLKSSEGTHEIFICNNCADFFEDSSEVLRKRKRTSDDTV